MLQKIIAFFQSIVMAIAGLTHKDADGDYKCDKSDRYPKKVIDPQKSDRGFLKGDRFKNCIKIISSLQERKIRTRFSR